MDIQLRKELEQQLVLSIQRYCAENLGGAVGDLQAREFLRFCLQEIAPCVYNKAITDAQGFFQEKAADLENTHFADEFAYWKDPGKSSVRRKAGFRP